MQKHFIFCLVLLIEAVSATIILADFLVICGPNQYKNLSSCWNSCADPRFKQCPDAFLAIFRPEFCAYTRDDYYVSMTFVFQVCLRHDALAFRNEAYSCDYIKCGSDEVCRNGFCVRGITQINPCATVRSTNQ